MESGEHGIELWGKLKEANPKNPKDIQKLMRSFGYSIGETEELTGKLKKTEKNKIEELREEIYLRFKLKMRLLQEHTRDSNLLVTIQAMNELERELIDNLTKLGEIAPVQSNMGGLIGSVGGIEQFILTAYNQDKRELPKLKEANPIIDATLVEDDTNEN